MDLGHDSGGAKDLSLPAHRHLIQGRVAQERRRTRALAEFDQALALWPDNPWARYYAAMAAEELGDFDRALGELRDSIRIDAEATDARTRAARLLLAKGNPNAALVILETSFRESPLEVEGLILGMHLSGLVGNTTSLTEFLTLIETRNPMRVGEGLAAAANGLALRNGPGTAVSMIVGAPNLDFGEPRYANALRSVVRHSRAAGQNKAARKAIEETLAVLPETAAYEEIRALDLELTGAPLEQVRAKYLHALELDPNHMHTLVALGRLSLASDPAAAVGYFDRAAVADPTHPAHPLEAARALIALGKLDDAKRHLDALLLEFPYEGAAASERAKIDLSQGVATDSTLERARRAVAFGGGADELDLLSQVLAKRNEPELAARAAEQAKHLREAEQTPAAGS